MKSIDTKKRPLALIILLSVVGLLVLLGGGFVGWALLAAPAGALASDALASDEQVTVIQDQWLVFQPKAAAAMESGSAGSTASDPSAGGGIGFIFYPGARVDFHAYAPLVRPLAQAGYLAVIVPMPLNLAMFDIKAADRIRAAFPRIKTWVIAGHSLGGAMAAQYLAESRNPPIPSADSGAGAVRGLVLWGAFSASDLSRDGGLRVLSVSGSQDGLSTPAKIHEYAKNLPPASQFQEIVGANHAQFGDYGDQQGDLAAGIPPAKQRAAVVQATLDFLAGLR